MNNPVWYFSRTMGNLSKITAHISSIGHNRQTLEKYIHSRFYEKASYVGCKLLDHTFKMFWKWCHAWQCDYPRFHKPLVPAFKSYRKKVKVNFYKSSIFFMTYLNLECNWIQISNCTMQKIDSLWWNMLFFAMKIFR